MAQGMFKTDSENDNTTRPTSMSQIVYDVLIMTY
jgi:hypothetical protein